MSQRPRSNRSQDHQLSPNPIQSNLSPTQAARMSAERRNLESVMNGFASLNIASSPLKQQRRPFEKILDSLLAKASTAQATETMETMLSLIKKELAELELEEANKTIRFIRFRQPKINRVIIKVDQALDYLIESGFRKSVQDHEERISFVASPSKVESLKISEYVLRLALTRTISAHDLEKIRKEAATQENERAIGNLLLSIQEDGRLREEKEERRKALRRARNGGEDQKRDLNPVPAARDLF